MGIPPYLLGLGIPLFLGLLGIGLYLINQERYQPNQERYQSTSHNSGRRTPFFDNSVICPICLEDMSTGDSSPLTCGHILHDVCLVELHKRKQLQCPKCRADIHFK